jgi:hypothetical protein
MIRGSAGGIGLLPAISFQHMLVERYLLKWEISIGRIGLE